MRGRPLRPQLSRGCDDATKLETAKEAPRNPTVSRSMVGPSGILTRGHHSTRRHIYLYPKNPTRMQLKLVNLTQIYNDEKTRNDIVITCNISVSGKT